MDEKGLIDKLIYFEVYIYIKPNIKLIHKINLFLLFYIFLRLIIEKYK